MLVAAPKNGTAFHEHVKHRRDGVVKRARKFVKALGLRGIHVAFDEVHKLADRCRVFLPLRVYGGVTPFVAEGADATPARDLLYGIFLHARSVVKEWGWTVAMCGTGWSIEAVLKSSECESPTRGLVARVQTLGRTTRRHMCAMLQHYFAFEPAVFDDKRVQDALDKLRGRAIFSFDFLVKRLVKELQDAAAATDDAAASSPSPTDMLLAAAASAYVDAVEQMKAIFKVNWRSDRRWMSNSFKFAPPLDEFTRLLYTAQKLTNGYILGNSVHALRLIVSESLFVLPEPKANEAVDLAEEPASVFALEAVGDEKVTAAESRVEADPIMWQLTKQVGGLGARAEVRGYVVEDFVHWHVLRVVRLLRQPTLNEVFSAMLPDGFEWPRSLADMRVVATRAVAGIKPAGGIVMDAYSTHKGTRIYTNLEPLMGADGFVPTVRSDGRPAGGVALQIKADSSISFRKALRTASRDKQFLRRHAGGADGATGAGGGVDDDEDAKDADAALAGRRWFEALLGEFSELSNRWIPAVFSVRPWSAKTVKLINAFNKKNKSHQPVLLLTSSPEAFGSQAHDVLRYRLGATYTPKEDGVKAALDAYATKRA